MDMSNNNNQYNTCSMNQQSKMVTTNTNTTTTTNNNSTNKKDTCKVIILTKSSILIYLLVSALVSFYSGRWFITSTYPSYTQTNAIVINNDSSSTSCVVLSTDNNFSKDCTRNNNDEVINTNTNTYTSINTTDENVVEADSDVSDVTDVTDDPDVCNSKNVDIAYYEGFVHPIMFASNYPETVAILVSVGEGRRRTSSSSSSSRVSTIHNVVTYTLQQILMHNTVTKVTVIVDDDNHTVVHTNNHTIIDSIKSTCHTNDERVEIILVNDLLEQPSWRFNSNNNTTNSYHDTQWLFDVIFLISHDLSSSFWDDYNINNNKNQESFLQSLYHALNQDGLIVYPLGMVPKLSSSSLSSLTKEKEFNDITNNHDTWSNFFSTIQSNGYESIHVYSEWKHSQKALYAFAVTMKSVYSRKEWYSTPAEMAVKIHQRINVNQDGTTTTSSSTTPFHYFDESVMKKYQTPHKLFETLQCHSNNLDDGSSYCGLFDFQKNKNTTNIPLSQFNVHMSKIGDNSGRGLFTKVNIKKGSLIGVAESIYPVYLNPSSIYFADIYSEYSNESKDVFQYADGYGWQSAALGWDSYYVESNILTFANHGCNNTFNIDATFPMTLKANLSRYNSSRDYNVTEQNVEITDFPALLRPLYSPYFDRHLHHKEVMWNEAVKDISAGDEILSDYLFYTMYSPESFYDESQVLKRICNGEEIGLVSKNEEC